MYFFWEGSLSHEMEGGDVECVPLVLLPDVFQKNLCQSYDNINDLQAVVLQTKKPPKVQL